MKDLASTQYDFGKKKKSFSLGKIANVIITKNNVLLYNITKDLVSTLMILVKKIYTSFSLCKIAMKMIFKIKL